MSDDSYLDVPDDELPEVTQEDLDELGITAPLHRTEADDDNVAEFSPRD